MNTDSCGIDCFTKNWAKEIIYAFPPFAIISRMLKEIEKDEATGVIIVPHFTTQPWFSRLLKILIEDPLLLPKSFSAFLQKECQKKLYQSSYNPREQVHKSDMKHTFIEGSVLS